MIPLNNHVLIRPLKHEDFVEGENSYDEKGEVLALPFELIGVVRGDEQGYAVPLLEIGDIVYFDSYLCAKYPSPDPDVPYWLVDFKDIRAKDAKKIPE